MTTPLVDSHCHLQLEAFNEDRDEVIARSLQRLEWLVVIGDTLESSRAGIELAAHYPQIYAAAAVHPHAATSLGDAQVEELRGLCQREKVVALGEIGLDYFYNLSPPEDQRKAFVRQLELAVELSLPIIIHCRNAIEELTQLLDPFVSHLAGGVMHCFSGDPEFARQCLDWGLYVSFAGNVTFPKAEDLRQAARIIPQDRLLVETDSPYLAPQAIRGRRCEPWNVQLTTAFIAQLRGEDPEQLGLATACNARRVFRIE